MFSITHRKTHALLLAVDAPGLVSAPLADAQLAGADLHFAVLYQADLRRADLRGANLSDADLGEAGMEGANLSKADCRRADLRDADLSRVNFAQADLRYACLAGARLAGARLDQASFTGIVLSDATYDEATRWPRGLDPRRYGARPVMLGGDAVAGVASVRPTVPIPTVWDDGARLAALQRYQLQETLREQEFDDLTRLASLICGAPMAVLSMVDEQRQWFKSHVRSEPGPVSRDLAFFHHATLEPDHFGVPPAEGRTREVPSAQVIAGPPCALVQPMPFVAAGAHALGTLCEARCAPRPLGPEQREAVAILARQAAAHFQLHRTYDELQKLEELRDRLTHMIVHDLRQPLQSLMGGLHTLRFLGDLSPEQDELLQMSVGGGEVLLGMVNDLLDINKLENGMLELDYAPVAPGLLMETALARLTPLAVDKQLILRTEIQPGLPCVEGDQEKLARTLVNLLGNAIKFTPRGGTIIMGASDGVSKGTVLFSVADTGEGIPAEAFDRIFEKFGQVEHRSEGRNMSTGLGLTFCKMVVEAHGGAIWVTSVPGKGSNFLFQLPIVREAPAQPNNPGIPSVKVSRSTKAKRAPTSFAA
jgi:signal transduction histidine kinase